MVMHARKYPRHNDGYYDRNQTHPFEEKYPSKSHSGGGGSGGSYYDRYGDRSGKETPSSYNRVRDESPGRPSPRYQNKSSYKERTKERVDKGCNNSPGDRGLNHYHNARSDVDRHGPSSAAAAAKPATTFKTLESLKSTEPKDPKTEQIQKSALRVSGDWSEHRSSSGKKYYYNCKSEVSQWEKPKDWIELSANLGRPIDNPSSSRGKDRNGRDVCNVLPAATSSKSSDDRYKHSSGGMPATASGGNHRGTSGGGTGYPPSSTAGSAYPGPTNTGGYLSPAADHHRHSQHPPPHRGLDNAVNDHRDRVELRKQWSVPDRYGEYHHQGRVGTVDMVSGRGESGLQRIPVVCRSSNLQEGPSNHGGGQSGAGGQGGGGSGVGGSGSLQHRGQRQRGSEEQHHPQHHPQHHHHRHGGENHQLQHYHKGGSAGAAFNGARHHGDHLPRNENEDSRQTEDMDISPGSTPTSSRPNSHLGTPISNNAQSAMTSSMGSNDLTQQAIQTLQKLQAALMAQQHQLQQQQHTTNTTVSQSPRSAPDVTPPHQPPYVISSPQVNNASGHNTSRVTLSQQLSQVDEDSRESVRSDRSVRSSRRGSPTPSVASSQSVSLSGSSLGAANKKQDSVQLTPSLSNYYNDALIEHCANIQADQAERQANRYGEEAHSVGTLHCTQVSVDLKRARSLVRIAEIQATLQEQRILFLRQQTRDLDNMRSQNSFMPSQQDT